jgi:alpha-beta hydrolase superfamily lysophospholipase
MSNVELDQERSVHPVEVQIDVTEAVRLGEKVSQSAWIFSPDAVALKRHPRPPIIVCLPAGGYDKRYWHFEMSGRQDYSFARHMAAAGFVVIALDHVGVGDSTRPVDGDKIHLKHLAQGSARVAEWVRDAASKGTLIDGLGPLVNPRMVGIGHALGSPVALLAQAESNCYDAIAILSYTVMGNVAASETSPQADRSALSAAREIALRNFSASLDGYIRPPHKELRSLLYLDDVPSEVIEAADATSGEVPRWCAQEANNWKDLIRPAANKIDVPLLIGLGVPDLFARQDVDLASYPSCDDTTVIVFPGSAHCHTFSSTRHYVWDRLGGWIGGLQ